MHPPISVCRYGQVSFSCSTRSAHARARAHTGADDEMRRRWRECEAIEKYLSAHVWRLRPVTKAGRRWSASWRLDLAALIVKRAPPLNVHVPGLVTMVTTTLSPYQKHPLCLSVTTAPWKSGAWKRVGKSASIRREAWVVRGEQDASLPVSSHLIGFGFVDAEQQIVSVSCYPPPNLPSVTVPPSNEVSVLRSLCVTSSCPPLSQTTNVHMRIETLKDHVSPKIWDFHPLIFGTPPTYQSQLFIHL